MPPPPSNTNKKLSIAEEVTRKLRRMESKPLSQFLQIAASEFDLAVGLQCKGLLDVFNEALTELDEKCETIEKYVGKVFEWKQNTTTARVNQALVIRDEERKEKQLLKKWLSQFTPSENNGNVNPPSVDAVDFAFIRFSLNMAIACDVCPVQKQLDAGTPAFLVSMLKVKNDCVVGPATMALAHLSLHDECKGPIALSGGIEACVYLINNSTFTPIISQCCKTLSSLALLPANKPLLARKGGIKALVEIVLSVAPDNYRVDDLALGSALSGLCNCAYGNDANRNLIVELDVMRGIEYICSNWTDTFVLASIARLICNLAFSNVYTALSCLSSHCEESLITSIKKAGATQHPDVCEAAMMAFCNLSNAESNQTHCGASGVIELCVSIFEDSQDPKLLRAAALACASMGYKSFVNKIRMGDKGIIRCLLEVALGRGMGGESDEDVMDSMCCEGCCFALATLLLNQMNHQIMKELDAIEMFVQLVLETESMEVLSAGAMVIAALTPRGEEKKRLLCEGRALEVQDCGGRDALIRCKQWVYGRKTPPKWLMDTILIFDITEEEALEEQRMCEEKALKIVSDDLFMDDRSFSSGVSANTFQDEFYKHVDLWRECKAEIQPAHLEEKLVDLKDKLY